MCLQIGGVGHNPLGLRPLGGKRREDAVEDAKAGSSG